ncbi:MAG: GDP-mannose 4,6-dehydratase [Lysobacterales bacterium]
MSRRALITGITGQDGAYLARLLIARGYTVAGTYRPTSSLNLWRLQALGLVDHPQLRLCEHELTDFSGALGLLDQTQPDEVYNLAAQSFVGLSFKQPVTTAQVTGIGPLVLLEAIRMRSPSTRFYQASSSEMFGGSAAQAIDEQTPLAPRSPYATAKCFAHWSTLNYREAYGLYAVSGILFNHESPLRSKDFLTRKVSDGVARIRLGKGAPLRLGNLSAERDWGYAPEYVDGIWRMLQANQPDTYVLATGRCHSVREFVSQCFAAAELPLVWSGSGVDEIGRDLHTGELRVSVDPALYRPADLGRVLGDPTRAAQRLGWRAQTGIEGLCQHMLKADLERVARE